MKNIKKSFSACLLLLIYIFSVFTVNSFAENTGACPAYSELDSKFTPSGIDVSSRFLELIKGGNSKKDKKLLVGGGVFGIRIKEDGVLVTETRQGSALSVGDRIIGINGTRVIDESDISDALSSCGGKPVTLSVIRSGNPIEISLTPKFEDGQYRLGITLRSTASGLGTITYIDPETGVFGGLGHGVCSPGSGELIPMLSGDATAVILGGIKKGEVGKPGELSGVLGNRPIGTLCKNTECGIFGILNEYDKNNFTLMSVGHSSELKEGAAEIISTVKNGKTMHYKIEISDIDYSSTGSKSFRIKLCDPTLIALSGGIVRGMSGSPIIQNGKLVGAVTHVLVANPTEGYGIFIENMLNAATEQVQPKAA